MVAVGGRRRLGRRAGRRCCVLLHSGAPAKRGGRWGAAALGLRPVMCACVCVCRLRAGREPRAPPHLARRAVPGVCAPRAVERDTKKRRRRRRRPTASAAARAPAKKTGGQALRRCDGPRLSPPAALMMRPTPREGGRRARESQLKNRTGRGSVFSPVRQALRGRHAAVTSSRAEARAAAPLCALARARCAGALWRAPARARRRALDECVCSRPPGVQRVVFGAVKEVTRSGGVLPTVRAERTGQKSRCVLRRTRRREVAHQGQSGGGEGRRRPASGLPRRPRRDMQPLHLFARADRRAHRRPCAATRQGLGSQPTRRNGKRFVLQRPPGGAEKARARARARRHHHLRRHDRCQTDIITTETPSCCS